MLFVAHYVDTLS